MFGERSTYHETYIDEKEIPRYNSLFGRMKKETKKRKSNIVKKLIYKEGPSTGTFILKERVEYELNRENGKSTSHTGKEDEKILSC